MTRERRERTVLLVVHTGRDEATEVGRRVEKVLSDNGIGLRVLTAEAVDRGSLHLAPDDLRAMGVEIDVVDADENAAQDCELVLVLGGDGTFLRAAELARGVDIPVLGVNLGRIGFLAEAEADAIDTVLDHVINRNYRVETRMTLDVAIRVDGEVVDRGWALNEASLEKGPRLGCSASLSRSTVARCPRSAATAFWCPPRPARRHTHSLPAARWCGRRSKRSWWYPTTPTHCSPGRWSPAPIPPWPSRSRLPGTTRWCSAMAVATWCCRRVPGSRSPAAPNR